MSDLISRREMLRAYQELCMNIACSECSFYFGDVLAGDCLFEKWIHSLPSAEPQITHCKDCTWWTKHDTTLQGKCRLHNLNPMPEWYCASGAVVE